MNPDPTLLSPHKDHLRIHHALFLDVVKEELLPSQVVGFPRLAHPRLALPAQAAIQGATTRKLSRDGAGIASSMP